MDVPDVIPQVELKGSVADTVRAIDAAIARLARIRAALANESLPMPVEPRGPYINAAVWPWTVAGWSLAALFLVLFLIAWAGG